ncbi:DUF892 family protein [Mucilaginibacter pedocola]|uniref:Uncharacterized protein n=1 Tax=Mucilaginibacter pedocola TaxID=1792845 RepID=A0A1S9P781_9SPHI|nr:DUF892 family protein [Mucilaginibacter pedocola]OOQ56806.1 hypothetical protein BC343_17635 [Mucilaginibacter pedocola]
MSTGVTKIKPLFVEHLNRLHCAKAHLLERLVDICEEPIFSNVKVPIEKALAQTELEIANLDRIYEILNTGYTFEDCAGLVAFLENTFSSFQANIKDPDISFVLILSYLHRITYIENAEKEILLLLADKLNKPTVKPLLLASVGKSEPGLIAELTTIYMGFLKGIKVGVLLLTFGLQLL